MPTQANLLGAGCPPLQAIASVGIPSLTLTAAGTSSRTAATALPNDFNVVTTTAANTGVRLNPAVAYGVGDTVIVVNHGASTLQVWPNTATGTIAAGSAGASVNVSTLKTAWFLNIGNDTWAFSVSA